MKWIFSLSEVTGQADLESFIMESERRVESCFAKGK